jgi:hypothetical protein
VTPSRDFDRALRNFADRLFVTGGADPAETMPLPEARLAIYRDGTLGNYRGMLRFTYTSALALVERVIAADPSGLPRDGDEIVRRFLAVAPSRTHSSREIADRFLVFLPHEYPSLVARRPDLLDLMRLERAELRTSLAPDDPGTALTDEEVDALAQEPLDALLARTVVRAPSAAIVRSKHHVVTLRERLQAKDAPAAAPAPAQGAEIAVVARAAPPRFAIGVSFVAPESALVLESAAPGEPVALERLALDWFAALPEAARDRDDAWKASVFASAVLQGLRDGALRAA